MIKLNDSNIAVGQIKQILHTFNLPQCQIGSLYPKANNTFITKNHIMRWDENLNLIQCSKYVYGQEYINLTSKLPIRNMVYDIETHRYLGKYLRFIRDYNGVDLMSMYNCFDGELSAYSLSFNLDMGENKKEISFKNGDDGYVVYKVPISVSPFTLKINNSRSAELCIYVDSSETSSSKLVEDVAKHTYKKINTSNIINYLPFETIKDDILGSFITSNIKNLYMLIKIPHKIDTSIVVLEGKYLGNIRHAEKRKYFSYKPTIILKFEEADTSLYASIEKSIEEARKDNAYVINVNDDVNKNLWTADIHAKDGELLLARPADKVTTGPLLYSGYSITSQLLSLENANKGYLLADRLLEYLVGNVISPLSEYYDIKRVQKSLDLIRISNHNYSDELTKIKSLNKNRHLGIWEESDFDDLRMIAYKSGSLLNYDVLGYLDSDLELAIKGVLDNVQV